MENLSSLATLTTKSKKNWPLVVSIERTALKFPCKLTWKSDAALMNLSIHHLVQPRVHRCGYTTYNVVYTAGGTGHELSEKDPVIDNEGGTVHITFVSKAFESHVFISQHKCGISLAKLKVNLFGNFAWKFVSPYVLQRRVEWPDALGTRECVGKPLVVVVTKPWKFNVASEKPGAVPASCFVVSTTGSLEGAFSHRHRQLVACEWAESCRPCGFFQPQMFRISSTS